jgi:hypothetical protein
MDAIAVQRLAIGPVSRATVIKQRARIQIEVGREFFMELL